MITTRPRYLARLAYLARLIAVLLVAVLVVISGGLPATARAAQDPLAAAQHVLDTRVAAVARGDETAFMATVDPKAPADFVNRQHTQFQGLHTAPIVDYQLRVRTDDSGDLAPGLDLAQRLGAQSAFLPETRQTYLFDGYDDHLAVDSLWLTFVERSGAWYVASDTDAQPIGLDSAREIWDFGPLAIQRSEHFVVLTHPDQSARGQQLDQLAEQAMVTFLGRWQRPWNARLPLIVPGSPEEATALLRTTAAVTDFVAFVTYTPLRDDGWSITPPRLYAQDQNLANVSPSDQVADLVHELTHAAVADATGPSTPTWLQEGLAEWMRTGKPTNVAPPTGHDNTLPDTAQFTTTNVTQLHLAYEESRSAVAYLSASYGADAPIKLFENLGARRIEPGSPAYQLDAAFRAVTGVGFTQFQTQWANLSASTAVLAG